MATKSIALTPAEIMMIKGLSHNLKSDASLKAMSPQDWNDKNMPENMFYNSFGNFGIYRKYDGIKATVLVYEENGDLVVKVVSRSYLDIPNRHTVEKLKATVSTALFAEHYFGNNKLPFPLLFDGDIMAQEVNEEEGWEKDASFSATQHAVMSVHGTPHFRYYMYDYVDAACGTFEERRARQIEVFGDTQSPKYLPIVTSAELGVFSRTSGAGTEGFDSFVNFVDRVYEAELENEGAEGVIINDMSHKYRAAKCSTKSPQRLKRKDSIVSEAVIYGWYPLEHNNSEVVEQETGVKKRTNRKQDQTQSKELLGGFRVMSPSGQTFSIGSGFTGAQRREYYNIGDGLIGKIVQFTSTTAGVKDAPRHPVVTEAVFRDERDMPDGWLEAILDKIEKLKASKQHA